MAGKAKKEKKKFSKKNNCVSRICEGCKVDKEKGREYNSKTSEAENGKTGKNHMT